MPDGSNLAPERVRAHDVARMTGLSVRTVQELAAAKKIPGAARDATGWSFDPKRVRAWIKANETTPAQARANCAADQARLREAKVRRASGKMQGSGDILARAQPWPATGCGIYFLICQGRIVYVGQAVNVVARVAIHAADKVFDAWSWVPCSKRDLDVTERAYINALMPELNKDWLTVRMRKAASGV